jgi:N-methylhydantoinase B
VLAGVLAKATGGRMPADQETIRYTGVFGTDEQERPYLMREVLGGGSGGRWYADGEDTIHIVPDSRNIPVEFVESRFPLRIERLGLATDSGGPGRHRGGLGYDKWIRVLRDASYMSIADRSILSCWGVNGGRAGAPFRATIAPGGPDEREMEGLTLAEPMRAGEVVRIRTTGGGGWGDPLERDPEAVLRDVLDGKVSAHAAEHDYGVVLTTARDPVRRVPVIAVHVHEGAAGDSPIVDVDATTERRAHLRARRGDGAFFDRGPGYARLANGAAQSAFDTLSDDERHALSRHADRKAAS